MSGTLTVVGLGPGDPRYLTPAADEALHGAEALYGYAPYLARVPIRRDQIHYPSDNREEAARAADALDHAARGGRVAIVSGGDPGVFAMAATVCAEIEAGLAFGTGHHGTTRGCLLHLDRLLKRRRPSRVLDVGCGAGVLAIAAARVLRRKVWLGDIDSTAVEVANANARLNGVGALCRAVLSRGVEARALREGAPFDLAFANILAKPLRLMAPSLAAVIGAGG